MAATVLGDARETGPMTAIATAPLLPCTLVTGAGGATGDRRLRGAGSAIAHGEATKGRRGVDDTLTRRLHAASPGRPGAPAGVALEDLLTESSHRGFVLLSEVAALAASSDDRDRLVAAATRRARARDLQVVDDLAEPAPVAAMVTESTNDPVRQYLNAIGRTDLLTPEQEVDLAKRARAGAAARELLATGAGGSEVVARLRRVDRDGRRAHERMIQGNLRLVVSVARRYKGRGLDLLDLVQEGNVGLMRAVEKFDHTKGYKFSTYATWWIRQALTRGLADKARTLRLPVHVHETLAKIRWTETKLEQRLGRSANEQELADELGLSIDRLREIKSAARDLVSLDTPVGEDGDATMGQLIADERAVDPEDAAAFLQMRALVHEALDSLTERERGIMQLRFGLDGRRVHTLEEVGETYDVTRERIRQIETKTLAKLRHPSRSDRLKELLDGAGKR